MFMLGCLILQWKQMQKLLKNISSMHFKVNPSLGGTTRNHLKEWLKNQKQPNHLSGPFR